MCICILIQTCYSLIAGPHTTNDTADLDMSLNCLVDWPPSCTRPAGSPWNASFGNCSQGPFLPGFILGPGGGGGVI